MNRSARKGGGQKVYSALSGPTDWILRNIKTTFTFFTLCLFNYLQEIKDTLDKEAIYRCMTTCYELSQVGENTAAKASVQCITLSSQLMCQSLFKLRTD